MIIKKILFIYIFFTLLPPLVAQNTLYFNEYDDLRPEINVFAGNVIECNNIFRKLLFYEPRSMRGSVLIGNMQSNVLRVLPAEQIGKQRPHMISTRFWDPHTRINFMFCRDVSILRDENRGWFSLELFNGFLYFYLQNNLQDGVEHHSPPIVQLITNRVFTAYYERLQYDIRINPRGFWTSYKSSFRITDTISNELIWEREIVSDSFVDLYWLTEQWYFIQNRSYFALGEHERQNIIYNYVTGETVSFAPEIIIGYGQGVVLTTTETESGFIGVTVWTPEKEILYRDSNFSISGITEREPNPATWGRPSIFISYFDFPYIYINVGRGVGSHPPYGTLIINLMDGKTYYTPLGYHLFGIFDLE